MVQGNEHNGETTSGPGICWGHRSLAGSKKLKLIQNKTDAFLFSRTGTCQRTWETVRPRSVRHFASPAGDGTGWDGDGGSRPSHADTRGHAKAAQKFVPRDSCRWLRAWNHAKPCAMRSQKHPPAPSHPILYPRTDE